MSDEQANNLIDETFEEIMEDTVADVIESLKDIEQKIFAEYGDPDTCGEVWALISTADRDGTDNFDEDAIEAILTGRGDDLYEGLANKELAVVHSLVSGKFGTLIRSGAWMSPTGSDVRPSDHPDKKSCIISASFLSNHVFFVVRFEDGTTEASSMNETEYMEGRAGGQQRLVDALLDFEYLPTALQKHEPDLYAEIVNKLISNGDENKTE